MVNQNEISSNTRPSQNEEQYVTSITPISKDDNSHTNPIIITPYTNDKKPNPNTPPLNQNEILNNNRIHLAGTIGSGMFNGYYHTEGDQREIELQNFPHLIQPGDQSNRRNQFTQNSNWFEGHKRVRFCDQPLLTEDTNTFMMHQSPVQRPLTLQNPNETAHENKQTHMQNPEKLHFNRSPPRYRPRYSETNPRNLLNAS